MNDNIASLMLSYIRRNRIGLILITLCIGIFSIVFSLYDLQTEAVYYAAVLSIVAGFIILLIDFLFYYRKHKLLKELHEHITYSIDKIPIPKDRIELDYYQLIEKIHSDRVQIISKSDKGRTDLIDYYTLWAHQIKTPIAAMHLLLQSEEECNHDLSVELFRIEQYVEMVLQYLRMESMSSDLVLSEYNLNGIVKQALRKYAKLFIRQKISLNFTEDLTLCKVLTDEKWLLFVIEQLLSNSLKYTKQGSITIRCSEKDDMYMHRVILVIVDTGIGIAKEDLPRVFDKGFTGYNGRSDKKSTGIGLYLVKRILSKLSHTITIESEVGIGTKVSIYLDKKHLMFE